MRSERGMSGTRKCHEKGARTRDFQFRHGPPRDGTPQRTAPNPSVNTSTEYSLARPTQFRNKHAVVLDSARIV
jgi:hypothetical protein